MRNNCTQISFVLLKIFSVENISFSCYYNCKILELYKKNSIYLISYIESVIENIIHFSKKKLFFFIIIILCIILFTAKLISDINVTTKQNRIQEPSYLHNLYYQISCRDTSCIGIRRGHNNKE